MSRKKFYVVWKGKKPGVYESWDDCKAQVFDFPNVKFKMFTNKQMAEQAYKHGSGRYFKRKAAQKQQQLKLVGQSLKESVAVDGTFNPDTQEIEYQGVNLETGEVIFERGPFHHGTINIAEFLAVAEALIYCNENHLDLPIYTDSLVAMSWIKDKELRTKVKWDENNNALHNHAFKILRLLQSRRYMNPIYKWQTNIWGSIPADYGKKYNSYSLI
jgi:ribonuclease HI